VFVGPVRAVPISVALILGAYAASVTDTLEVVAVTSDTVVAVLLVRPVAAVGRSVAAPSARDAATWRGRAQHLVRGAHHRAAGTLILVLVPPIRTVLVAVADPARVQTLPRAPARELTLRTNPPLAVLLVGTVPTMIFSVTAVTLENAVSRVITSEESRAADVA
jgi:hypothetical protein